MISDDSTDLRKPFFEIFGEIAVLYAGLEASVERLLLTLIDSDNIWLGLLTSDLSFAKSIEKVNELAKIRLFADVNTRNEVLDLMSRVDGLRIKRNPMIHGVWVVDDATLQNEEIVCVGTKWKRIPKDQGKAWTSTEDTLWKFRELTELKQMVGVTSTEVMGMVKRLRSVVLVPHQTSVITNNIEKKSE